MSCHVSSVFYWFVTLDTVLWCGFEIFFIKYWLTFYRCHTASMLLNSNWHISSHFYNIFIGSAFFFFLHFEVKCVLYDSIFRRKKNHFHCVFGTFFLGLIIINRLLLHNADNSQKSNNNNNNRVVLCSKKLLCCLWFMNRKLNWNWDLCLRFVEHTLTWYIHTLSLLTVTKDKKKK